jgi:hypothetical protein
MTTQSYNTVLAQTSDAEFRAWGLELHNALVAAGLVNTSDTGQIDFATVVRAAGNTAAGYKIYRFNDALQATAPIFLKLEFGSSSSNTAPNMWLTVGTGTNGAGTINGTVTPRRTTARSSLPGSAVTNYPTHLCVAPGYAGLAWKRGGTANQGQGGFHVCRSCDGGGNPTAEGVIVYTCAASAQPFDAYTLWFASSTARDTANTGYCMVGGYLGADTSTAAGLDVQAYKHYAGWPRMRCNPYLLAAYITDIPVDTVFTETPVGSTPRTYRAVGTAFGYAGGAGAISVNLQGCMLWE